MEISSELTASRNRVTLMKVYLGKKNERESLSLDCAKYAHSKCQKSMIFA